MKKSMPLCNDITVTLELAYLADESQCTELEREATKALNVGWHASTAAKFATVCKRAFSGEEERACDWSVQLALPQQCTRRREELMANKSFKEMLSNTPKLAASLIFDYHDTGDTSPSRHYLMARCNSPGCCGGGKNWYFRYARDKIWSTDVHRIYCGERQVKVALGGESKFEKSVEWVECNDESNGGCRFEWQLGNPTPEYDDGHCIVCGSQGLTYCLRSDGTKM